jgi:hypothetical protein
MKIRKSPITKKERQKASKRLAAMEGTEKKEKWDKSKVKEEGTVIEKAEKNGTKKNKLE